MSTRSFVAACITFVIASTTVLTGQKADSDKTPEARRPKVKLKARPDAGISPVRIVLTAELEGGSDDFEEYYCPTVVWEWGDGSASEMSSDCGPYTPGESQIKRRYTIEHTYKRSGRIRVYFAMRHRDKEAVAVGVNIIVQPGPGDNLE